MERMKLLLLLALWVTNAQCQQFNAQDATLAMLERVNEPLFIPKCEKGILLEIPDEYMPDRYRPMGCSLRKKFSEGVETPSIRIPIKMVPVPDISDLMTLPRHSIFSNFVPMHTNLASRLISIFMEMKSVEDFFSVAAYVRDRINPSLFVYGFSVALLHRPDCRSIRVPPVTETFPSKFVDGSVFGRAREEATILSDQTMIPMREYIEVPQDYTATDRETEHRLAYFREDLGVNLHHWHWHAIYPARGPPEVVQKDRRGELFYYMHQQVLARYEFERMSNKLPRTIRLLNFHEPIVEAYFPKLSSQMATRSWAARSSGVVLKDIDREGDQLKFDIGDLDRWRNRLLDAIHRGRVDLLNGSFVALTERSGIDMLGNMVEASDISLNKQFYGDMHNYVHVAISLVHDPDHRHLETFSVLGESSTAMRDPVFYRIHAMINDIFNMHKLNLQSYSVQQLDFTGVRVTGIELNTPTAGNNVFETFWQKNLADLSRGMDFLQRGAVYAKITHLNHSDFSIKINVENQGAQRRGLVRIMLAPQRDDRGQIVPFIEQKNLFIELDKFIVDLNPGRNTFTRNSRQSAVTIPFEQTFRDLETGRPADNASQPVLDQFNFCGCGWPQHMLIPKGSPEGFPSVLFVMVSNLETDWNTPPANAPQNMCSNAASYCGLRGQNYPDRRAMGYPFDRLPRAGAVTLQSFLTPNMGVQNVIIRFMDRTVDNTQPPMMGNVVPPVSPPPAPRVLPAIRPVRPKQPVSSRLPKSFPWNQSNRYAYNRYSNILSYDSLRNRNPSRQ